MLDPNAMDAMVIEIHGPDTRWKDVTLVSRILDKENQLFYSLHFGWDTGQTMEEAIKKKEIFDVVFVTTIDAPDDASSIAFSGPGATSLWNHLRAGALLIHKDAEYHPLGPITPIVIRHLEQVLAGEGEGG